MATEKEPPAGLTQEEKEEFTNFRTIASSAHPIFIGSIVTYYTELVRRLSRSEKPTSNSGK